MIDCLWALARRHTAAAATVWSRDPSSSRYATDRSCRDATWASCQPRPPVHSANLLPNTPVRTACPLRPQRPIFCALVFFSPSMHAYAVRVVLWVLAFASTRPAAKFSRKAGRALGSDLLLQPYMTVTQRKPVGQKKKGT